MIAEDAHWQRLANEPGVVPYEHPATGPITLYSGHDQWLLENDGGWWWLTPQERVGKRQSAAEVFESWLVAKEKPAEAGQRRLCPATLVRTDI